jgi:phage virion morphogenesis protein
VISVEFNNDEIKKALQNLQNAVGNLRPALADIGEYLAESTKQRFESQTGPDGQHWKDNSAVTIARKGVNHPLTGESGKLMDEIHYNLIGDDLLEIGSPMEYAAMQQFGGSKSEFPNLWGDIPAREFLGVSDDDEKNILDIISRHLRSD